MPASCDACGRVDLHPANRVAWGLFCDYPSLISHGLDGWQVDYQSAMAIMASLYLDDDIPLMLKKLEAIKTGYATAKQSANSR